MRLPFFITLLTASVASNFSYAMGIDSIANALANMPGYAAEVSYAVTLPQAQDDVVYSVGLRQPRSADSYLIDWSVNSPSGPVEGFTAWFDGNFYNFRNRRLREHHAADGTSGGEQNSAQFASLLPSRMAMQLREVAAGGYIYNVREKGDEVIVEATRALAGEPDAELTWVFSASTLEPLSFYADYNPGAISGQQVKAVYTPAEPIDTLLSEEFLRQRYPEPFARFRESQFAIENMRGESLPAFSLPLASGGRLTRLRDDAFDLPTLVVLVDPLSPLAPRLVSEVRGAVAAVPFAVDVIWASCENNPDSASELLAPVSSDERVVTSARSLAVDCGAATLPVVMACGRDGRIADLIVGMNNTLRTDVIQLLTTL